MEKNISIRLEKKEEYWEVENLVRESFWNVYRPGCMEHYVLHQLRKDKDFVLELDFVMYLNTKEGSAGKSSSSGFRPASEFGIRYHGIPDGEDASFFLCRELIPGYLKGITGVYAPPSGYLVDSKEVEKFDRLFPPKEKKKLPGQLFE